MMNSEQFFQINKRINQIKRDLQTRHDKAHQWSVPYEKILKKAQLLTNVQRNSLGKQSEQSFQTKEEKKHYLQQKVKQSRQKINNFHNQLKQLQQLKERKTKLYIKRSDTQQNKLEKQKKQDKRNSIVSNQLKTINKTFHNLSLSNPIFSKTLNHNLSRTSKDRVNPFLSLKPQSIVEIFLQARQSGKENIVNQALGMGIQFTPYSNVLKKQKKEEDFEHKILIQNSSIYTNKKVLSLKTRQNLPQKKNHLEKILGSKVQEQGEIYMHQIQAEKPCINSKNNLKSKRNLNMFEKRMKKLLEQTKTIENCEGNYVDLLRQQKRASRQNYSKTAVGKIRANKTYKTIFGQNK